VGTVRRPDLLRLYMQDHFTGAMGGVALARRTSANNAGTPYGDDLAEIANEIEQDRESLAAIMDCFEVAPDRLKGALALVAERAGRLKLNGALLRRSPLSTIMELEGLQVGVHGKAAGWRALREVAEFDSRLSAGALDELIARAEDQSSRLERIRLRAAQDIFASGSA
jgi:hypothetical protein